MVDVVDVVVVLCVMFSGLRNALWIVVMVWFMVKYCDLGRLWPVAFVVVVW